jgi:hypothetical protein
VGDRGLSCAPTDGRSRFISRFVGVCGACVKGVCVFFFDLPPSSSSLRTASAEVNAPAGMRDGCQVGLVYEGADYFNFTTASFYFVTANWIHLLRL